MLVMDEKKHSGEILTLLRQRTGVDFTFYKHATLQRRMHRRMVLLDKFETLQGLRPVPPEATARRSGTISSGHSHSRHGIFPGRRRVPDAAQAGVSAIA